MDCWKLYEPVNIFCLNSCTRDSLFCVSLLYLQLGDLKEKLEALWSLGSVQELPSSGVFLWLDVSKAFALEGVERKDFALSRLWWGTFFLPWLFRVPGYQFPIFWIVPKVFNTKSVSLPPSPPPQKKKRKKIQTSDCKKNFSLQVLLGRTAQVSVCRLAALVQICRGKREIVAEKATAWRCQSFFLVSWEWGVTSSGCFLLLSSFLYHEKNLQGKELVGLAVHFHSSEWYWLPNRHLFRKNIVIIGDNNWPV